MVRLPACLQSPKRWHGPILLRQEVATQRKINIGTCLGQPLFDWFSTDSINIYSLCDRFNWLD